MEGGGLFDPLPLGPARRRDRNKRYDATNPCRKISSASTHEKPSTAKRTRMAATPTPTRAMANPTGEPQPYQDMAACAAGSKLGYETDVLRLMACSLVGRSSCGNIFATVYLGY